MDEIENQDEEESHPFFYYDVGATLDYFEQYLKTFEEYIDRKTTSLLAEYPDLETNPDDWWGTDFFYFRYFPNILRESLFIAICSFVEAELNRICNWIRNDRNLNLAIRDLAGQGIGRARNYLVKVVGINPSEAEWEGLINYQKLRNCLVHAQGDLSECDHANYLRDTYIPSQRYLSLSDDNVILSRGFCEEVISKITVFFRKLETELSQKD